jgi:hypothetical protein
MRAPKCRSCDAKIEGAPAFCARCGEPTPFATADDRTRHDLEKWRRHREVAEGTPAPQARVPASILQATGAASAPTREEQQPQVERRAPFGRRAKDATPALIDLDADNPFAYSACVSCQRTDWIVRTGRNEDGSFRYWCLRCSRSFKTDMRLAHAAKPFVVSGSLIAVLTLLTNIR